MGAPTIIQKLRGWAADLDEVNDPVAADIAKGLRQWAVEREASLQQLKETLARLGAEEKKNG
jgi:hypothetical protein